MPTAFNAWTLLAVISLSLPACTPSDQSSKATSPPSNTVTQPEPPITSPAFTPPPPETANATVAPPPEEQLHAINAELRKKFITTQLVRHSIVDETKLIIEFNIHNSADRPITALAGVIKLETAAQDILFLYKNFEYEGPPIQPKEARKITQEYDVLYIKRLDLLPELQTTDLSFSFEPDKIQF